MKYRGKYEKNYIGNILKNAIKAKYNYRTDFAKEMGVSEGAVRKWEAEGLEDVSLKRVRKINRLLNINFYELSDNYENLNNKWKKEKQNKDFER